MKVFVYTIIILSFFQTIPATNPTLPGYQVFLKSSMSAIDIKPVKKRYKD